MDENKTGLTGRGISIRNVQVVITAVTLIVAMLLLVATFRASAGFTLMQEETHNYIKLQQSASDLQKASDYLTEQVRCYVITGEPKYLKNYFIEAKETRRRDKALETLSDIMGESEAVSALSSAMDESVNLMDREYYSMRLASEAFGYDISDLPEEIQNVELTAGDRKMSDTEKKDRAAQLVFDDIYQNEKTVISENMNSCLSELERTVEKEEKETADEFARLFNAQRILILVAILFTLSAMLFTLLLLVSPLLRAVVFIHEDEPIPVGGSSEFRFLADTYNNMYESNKKQKAQLEYEASHDYLTGLYNRSGYDFFMKNLDLGSTALIIIDVDKFKKINDENGHEIGDKILIKVAEAIKDAFRHGDHVCRLGGDEFAVILENVEPGSAQKVAEKVDMINRKLSDTSDGLPPVQISAGVAIGKGHDPDELFRMADASMYNAKSRGGSDYSIASEEDKTEE